MSDPVALAILVLLVAAGVLLAPERPRVLQTRSGSAGCDDPTHRSERPGARV
jgi:hypothetical protein